MKNCNVLIRRANLKDAEEIIDFNVAMAYETEKRELNSHEISEGVFNLIKNSDYGFYLVAESENRIVGSLMITTEWSDWRNGMFWWVQSVFVKNEWRRRGVYKKMYEKVKELANLEKNICGFRLYVEKNNKVAQTVYNRLGMVETEYKMFEEGNR